MNRNRKKTASWLIVVILLIAGVLLGLDAMGVLGLSPEDPVATESQDPAESASPAQARVALAGPASSEAGIGNDRRKAPRTFDEIYQDLIELFSENAYRHSALSEIEKGDYSKRASDLFEEMTLVVQDAGERALARVSGIAAPWTAESSHLEVRVCTLILDFNLQLLTNTDGMIDRRDLLVTQMLTSMPYSEQMASLVHGLLNEKPYLALPHEQALLDLAREADGESAFLAPFVKALLVTLWKNLDALGLGSADRMADLLAYFAEGKEGVLLTAAQDRLLLSERYRDLVVRQLIEGGDRQVMSNAAATLARNLPFDEAIDSIAILRSGAGDTHFGAAYSFMAEASPKKLAADYEERLADGVMPEHRRQEIVALGNYGGETGIESAKTAFAHDPAYPVKAVALLALGSSLNSQEFEPLLNSALSDPGFTGSVSNLYLLASALVNHANGGGEVNAVDRASAAMLSIPKLSKQARDKLERMRSQLLPK